MALGLCSQFAGQCKIPIIVVMVNDKIYYSNNPKPKKVDPSGYISRPDGHFMPYISLGHFRLRSQNLIKVKHCCVNLGTCC